MSTILLPAAGAPAPSTPSVPRRLLADLRVALPVSLLAGLLITLATGYPESLYEQLVYSVWIGLIAFAMVDLARLLVWPQPQRPAHQWLAFLGLMLLASLIGHFAGIHVGAFFLGHQVPSLADYPSTGRLSMVLFTFLGMCTMTLLVEYRERVARIRREHQEARLRAEVVERQALQAQLRLLQAQIEPHMLFNTLANLQGLIALDPERASRMLDQLIQYLRATLGATRADSTSLEQEFAAMEAYLGLMAVRMGARLAYRLDLPPGLRNARLPPLLLQPLVENAIVHGLEPKIEGGEILIEASAHDGLLDIAVRDSGLGLSANTAASRAGGGVGVATTRERLHALYGERAAVLLAPAQPQGTIVRLTLPLENPCPSAP
ncbi:histidine kinase [Massilia sp. YIM B02769]|uniref:sensor histidine kinase n=1 Tax=Massilia sp. YIM B02769 TaxID=3050129 RepID=UPI0025B6BB72|nr:histidine kinase [Massilia sp. YIM B02769]MDN4058976.1 histidine kinase [Massilia sp. YIM B02769]